MVLLFAFLVFADEPAHLKPDDIPGWSIVYGNFDIPDGARFGEAVSLIPGSKPATLVRSETPYDQMIKGVIVVDSLDSLRIALGGEVFVLVDPSGDSIRAGDWLVTSGATGRIMRADESYPLMPVVIGVALDSWAPGSADFTIKVLLTPGERITLPDVKSGDR